MSVNESIQEAVQILQKAGATEVYVFGSVATGHMRDDSDIDLAVRGLPPKIYFKTLSKLMDQLNREVDLLDLDEETPFTRLLVRSEKLHRVA